MDFNLVLGDDMKLKGQGEMVIRQGTHLMDNIVIELGGKYQGATAYLEFDLPKNRKHVSETMNITGDIRYGVPEDVTAYSGFGYMQLSILTGEILEKSALYAFEITSSICSSKAYSPKDKHDFFFNVAETVKDSRAQTDACKSTTENAEKSIKDMNILKTDIEQKLAAGAFKGEKGENGINGKDGRDGVDGKDGVNGVDGQPGISPSIGVNGNWFVGEIDTGIKARGTDGVNGRDGTPGISPHIGANKHWFIGDTDTGVKAEAEGAKVELATDYGTNPLAAIAQSFFTTEMHKVFDFAQVFSGPYMDLILPMDGKAMLGIFFSYEENVTGNYALALFARGKWQPNKEQNYAVYCPFQKKHTFEVFTDGSLQVNNVYSMDDIRTFVMFKEF